MGAAGLGWEVQCNGMEISQFTYFQQIGGFECKPVSLELTYGLERLAMFVQGVNDVYEIIWDNNRTKYGEVFRKNEEEQSYYNFLYASEKDLYQSFKSLELNAEKLIEKNLVIPAYEMCIKASHYFNLLDSRGVISVNERQAYILRIRSLVQKCCKIIVDNE